MRTAAANREVMSYNRKVDGFKTVPVRSMADSMAK